MKHILIKLTIHDKARAGEVITSARAMDEATMKQLYEYNKNFPRAEYAPTDRKRKAEHPEDWGGHCIRGMLQLLYITSFLCLLRYDEALRIQWSDVEFQEMPDGTTRIKIELDVRKTHQNGGQLHYTHSK